MVQWKFRELRSPHCMAKNAKHYQCDVSELQVEKTFSKTGLTDPCELVAAHLGHPAGQRVGADRTQPDFSGGKVGLVVGTFIFVVQSLSHV